MFNKYNNINIIIKYFFFLGATAADMLVEYLKKHSPVHPAIEWRITYLNDQIMHIYNNSSNSIYQFIKLAILLPIISLLLAR